MPFLELEIACSVLPFDHVIDPLRPSERGPDDAPYTRYDSLMSDQNWMLSHVVAFVRP